MPYLATTNVPGYLPTDDDPPVFDSPGAAWEHHMAEVERSYWGDGLPAPGQQQLDVEAAISAASHAPGTVYAPTPGYDGDHDLGIAYCVVEVNADGVPT